jgi:hypothetical protein
MSREEVEASRRQFLLRALCLVDKSNENERHIAENQPAAEVSTNTIHAHNDKPNNFREHCGGTRRRNYTRIELISQLDSWDCGIACLLMIDRWHRDDCVCDSEDDGNEDCVDARLASERSKLVSHLGTESIWTPDLMLQLQSWKTKQLTTKKQFLSSVARAASATFHRGSEERLVFVLASRQVMSADESYRDFQYYQKTFEEDQSRVASTLRDLHRRNVPMLQTTTMTTVEGDDGGRGLALSTVIDIVEREDCLAIVLLDNAVLRANAKAPNKSPVTNHQHESGCTSRPSYAGHYVVLCGTSDDPKHVELANAGENRDGLTKQEFCFVVCNPDPFSALSGSNYVFVTPERLEVSWRATGTDEDIIFLRKLPYTKGDNARNKTESHRFSERIQTLFRENFAALTEYFLPVGRN